MQSQRQTGSPQTQIEPGIKLWYLDGFGTFKDSTKLDTLQDYYHLYHPVFKNTVTATSVGNYATPYLDNNFFNRKSNLDFYFLQTREAYLLTPQSVQYYNTRTPYTLLDFTQSEHRTRKNETRFNVLHSQNVSPWWNFTFRFDQARSAGQYKNQESKNNFVTLYSSYNKERLSFHGGFISNSILNNENGGLDKDANLLEEPDTDFLDVNLTSVRSEFGSNYFFATGEYRFGRFDEIIIEREVLPEEDEEEAEPFTVQEFKPSAGIIYSFEYQNHSKDYIDEEDTTNTFFQHAYYGESYNKDSIRFFQIRNVVQLKQYENPDRKTSFGKRVFLGQEFTKAAMPGLEFGTFQPTTKRYSNLYVGGGIFRETGKFWTWNFDGRIYLLGRNVGQTEINGIISKSLSLLGDSLASLRIKGSIVNLMPNYFQEEFYSNRIRWNEDLKMEQRMTVNGTLEIPQRKLNLSANYALINNFIYNNTEGIPSQFGGQLLVLSAYADKDFNFRNLHFRTRLLWQKPSNEDILHLPDFSGFVSTYFKFVISKVLFTQIGFDVRYNTAYYADAYHPSTGMFYLQNETKLGDFPYIDAYANLRLKRTRLFFKMMNVSTEFMNKEYFTTPGYPMNRMTFRMGVAWAFYD
ncbi:MAG: putative porin [Mariniphaga sp.]|nr:putative porin [Mariniphaga sp.]